MPFPFDNSYARLPDAFFALTEPTPVSAPVMIRLNQDLATELGIDVARLDSPEGLAILAPSLGATNMETFIVEIVAYFVLASIHPPVEVKQFRLGANSFFLRISIHTFNGAIT